MILKGKSVYEGITIGKIFVYKKREIQIEKYEIDDTDSEINRFLNAKEIAKNELENVYDRASDLGESYAMIFKTHQVMLDDDEFVGTVKDIIVNEKVNAESAVALAKVKLQEKFSTIEDEYIKERVNDIKDICDSVIGVLCDISKNRKKMDEPAIIVADNLTPAETVQFDRKYVLAFATKQGSTYSHTAILSRTMNIPSVIGIDYANYADEIDGKIAIVDGFNGLVIIDPDANTVKEYEKKIGEVKNKELNLRKLIGKESITKSGKKVSVYANIGDVNDAKIAIQNDAEGIGLFRSEFLYLESENYPSEEMQFKAYKKVVEKMDGKKVIIRTLDIGADKQAAYFNIKGEENPAMGYRAIRICLDRVDMFKTQIRAIYRASYYGNIAILFPMIISMSEIYKIKEIICEVKEELRCEGIEFGECEIGVMIETPAAVMISDMIAKEVDFMSVGTNDLTQYTLAIDRQNDMLDKLYDAHHEAVIRMLEMVVKNAHHENCTIGICGELGADLSMTEKLINIGFDEISVAPSMILKLREIIRDMN